MACDACRTDSHLQSYTFLFLLLLALQSPWPLFPSRNTTMQEALSPVRDFRCVSSALNLLPHPPVNLRGKAKVAANTLQSARLGFTTDHLEKPGGPFPLPEENCSWDHNISTLLGNLSWTWRCNYFIKCYWVTYASFLFHSIPVVAQWVVKSLGGGVDRKEASKNSVHKRETEGLKEYPRD